MAFLSGTLNLPGVYNSSLPTLASGDRSALAVNANGVLLVAAGGSGATADQVQGNIAAGSADSGNPVKVGGVYSSTLPTLSNGQRGNLQLTTNGSLIIGGHVASGATDVGNPIKVGGIYNSSPITLTNGQRGDAQLSASGGLHVNLRNIAGTELGVAAAPLVVDPSGGAVRWFDGSSNRAAKSDTSGNLFVVGTVASGAADSGNPVKMGGVYNSSAPTFTTGQRGDVQLDASGNQKVTLATLIGGEDLTNNRLMTRPTYTYSAVATADVQVKGSAGYLHSVTISCNDAAPTAGSIIIYDNTAESGTQVFNHTFTTTPFMPFTIILDYTMATGIYVGFTTTNDVNVSCAYL